MTNENFTNTSIKIGILLQLMTTDNKKKTNRIEGSIIILKSVSYRRISLEIILYNKHTASLCVKSSSCRKIFIFKINQ